MSVLWRPVSSCGPACLPTATGTGVPRRRQVSRLVALLGVLAGGVALLAVLPVLTRQARGATGRRWARTALAALGVRPTVRGRLPRGPVLLVANHISWLDVLAVLAVTPARMVAKTEVRGWPLLGVVARAAGTIFVDRARPRALPSTVAEVATALRAGRSVAVFPEGTTWCGAVGAARCPAGGPFRPAMFQAAIDAGVPVVPLRIGYGVGASGAGATAPAFLGDENLWCSLRRVLSSDGLTVSVTVGGALHPQPGADRRPLSRAAASTVRLGPVRPALHPVS
ncbi:lysophospholipid acyltransferase family protein [Micromonospora echinofusca]|uniref:1-acyl-sn-glycerol-3-phosphate acyltransferase n=1 Tax=Micromonospora echinofusca TaxID=47858 RepID=A0ABS3VZX3_MICEH|nr:lysophospholipid acyltransferase family protein [Micromonospora echinofusca]MBO4209913.1 1-acyl-sn-glycerol-3-phosphate acyltransferase [Micromonospora echinofusca]